MREKFNLDLLPPDPTLEFERALWDQGFRWIAGIDEAGRGPIAGPVMAAAVILPCNPQLENDLRGVRDSKQMTAPQREYWEGVIKTAAIAYGVGSASSEEIDALRIAPATLLAARRAIASLAVSPEHLLLDFIRLSEYDGRQTALIKGDARCLSIAAASVLAKTARDAHLRELDLRYPGYGFARHKGYCTEGHLAALQRLGPCPVHRFSFQPVSLYSSIENG